MEYRLATSADAISIGTLFGGDARAAAVFGPRFNSEAAVETQLLTVVGVDGDRVLAFACFHDSLPLLGADDTAAVVAAIQDSVEGAAIVTVSLVAGDAA